MNKVPILRSLELAYLVMKDPMMFHANLEEEVTAINKLLPLPWDIESVAKLIVVIQLYPEFNKEVLEAINSTLSGSKPNNESCQEYSNILIQDMDSLPEINHLAISLANNYILSLITQSE